MIRLGSSAVAALFAVVLLWGCASTSPPLIKAAYDGDVKSIQDLLRKGQDVNMKGNRWRETALIAAVGRGHLDAVKYLLDNGADIDQFTINGESALTAAVWGCHRDVAKMLVTHGADLNIKNRDSGATPLMPAVACEDPDLVQFLIDAGADAAIKDNSGISPLMTAVWQNNIRLSKILIDAGANIQTAPEGYGSPLYEAAAKGYDSIVSMLIEKGADLNFISKDMGWSPLMIAIAENRSSVASTLIKAGADISFKAQNGFTPLLMAADMGNAAIAKILCEKGADVNAQDDLGWTALHFAAAYRYEDVAALLLQHHASVDIPDKKGRTALMCAQKSKNSKIIAMLKNPDPAFIATIVPKSGAAFNAVDAERIEEATIERVRSAKPLKRCYNNIVFNRFEVPDRLREDYSDAAVKCEQSAIDRLKHMNVYKKVAQGTAPPYAAKTVLVDGFVEEIHYASAGSRIIFGPLAGRPFMNVRIKLTDAESRAVIHEKVIATTTNVWFASATGGTSDAYLPVKVGEIIGEYLHAIIPAEPLSN